MGYRDQGHQVCMREDLQYQGRQGLVERRQ